jgi:hypothetical protein
VKTENARILGSVWYGIIYVLLASASNAGMSSPHWPERGWKRDPPLVILRSPSVILRSPSVILSAAKDLAQGNEILRCAQDDIGQPIRLSSCDELIEQ